MKKTINFLFVILALLSFSCSKDEESISDPPGIESETLDVNITSTSYILNTISPDHLDTNYFSGSYINTINLKMKLDKPENRNQINKLIIYGENGLGWEFYNSDLNSFFVDSIGGFLINNLIIYNTSQYYSDLFFRIKIFAKNNTTNIEYECVVKNEFLPYYSVNNSWIDHHNLLLTFGNYYDNSKLPKQCKVHWLDRKTNKIGENEILLVRTYNSSSSYTNITANVNNVPDSAVYFYTEFSDRYNFVERNLKTAKILIDNRFPSNLKFLNKSISINNGLYIPEKGKVILWNTNTVYIINYNDLSIEKTLQLDNNVSNIKYNKDNGLCYLSTSYSTLYSLDLSKLKLTLVNTFNYSIYSFAFAGNYLLTSLSYDYLSVMNLNTNTILPTQNFWGTNFYDMVFNEVLQQFYCVNSYDLTSFSFDTTDGSLSNLKSKSINSSSGNRLFIFPDRTKFIFQNGGIYKCSKDDNENMGMLSQINKSFKNIEFSDNGEYFITLASSVDYPYTNSVNVYSIVDYQHSGSLNSFYGTPKYLSLSGDIIRIFSSTESGSTIVEEYTIDELISSNSLLKRNHPVLKYYFPKKIK